VRRALVSVFDKTGLEDLVRGLADAGVELVSTGGSAALIAGLGLPVTKVEELTGFPECLEGRVKTLHPRVHAGLLADTRKPDHLAQLADLGVEALRARRRQPLPLRRDGRLGATPEDQRREHRHRRPVDGPGRRQEPPERRGAHRPRGSMPRRWLPSARRRVHLRAAPAAGGPGVRPHRGTTTSRWRRGWATPTPTPRTGPASRPSRGRRGRGPRGCATARTRTSGRRSISVACPASPTATQLHGKEMSYNNYVDADAALRACRDHGDQPTCAIIKHANPCGIAVGEEGGIAQAHRRAHACDPVSAFGGIIAVNRPVTLEMAATVKDIFTEVVVAPDFRRRRPRGAHGQEEHPAAHRRLRRRSRRPGTGLGAETRPIRVDCSCSIDRVDAVVTRRGRGRSTAATTRPTGGSWPVSPRTRRPWPTSPSRGGRCAR
jgi:phosphoribosylaminoimidazolecarboxamide formyltransferase/IMP cyclohydrolase